MDMISADKTEEHCSKEEGENMRAAENASTPVGLGMAGDSPETNPPALCGKYAPLRDWKPCALPYRHKGTCAFSPPDEGTWRRANYIPAPHFFELNRACVIVNGALDGFGCYLVGSSMERRDYRDVDVRFIMSDEAFDRLFRVRPEDANSGSAGWLNPLWSLMCTTISVWMSKVTDLPIDFQIQRQTQANASHPKGKRGALGIFLDYPGERPSDLKVATELHCASESGDGPKGTGT